MNPRLFGAYLSMIKSSDAGRWGLPPQYSDPTAVTSRGAAEYQPSISDEALQHGGFQMGSSDGTGHRNFLEGYQVPAHEKNLNVHLDHLIDSTSAYRETMNRRMDRDIVNKQMDSLSKQKMPETPMPVGAAGLKSMVGLFGPAALGGLGGALPGNSGMVPGTVRGMTAGVGGNLGHMLGGKASEALEHAGIQSPALRALLPILGYGGGAYAGYRAGKALTKTDKEKAQEKSANSQFETLKAPKVDISGLKNWNQLDPTAYSDDSGNSGWHLNMAKSASMEKDALGLLAKAIPAALSWGGKAIGTGVRAIPKMLGGVAKFLGKENPQVAGLGAATAGTWRNQLFDWGRKIRGAATNATNAANSAFQTNRVAPMMNAFNQLPQWGQKTLGALGSVGRFGKNVFAGGAGVGKGLGGMIGAGNALWGAGRLGQYKGMYDGAQLGVQGAAGYASNMLDDLAGKADGSIIDRIGMAYKMSDPEFLRETAKQMRDPQFASKMMGR